MSQQGTRAFYQIIETIKTQLLEDPNVNTVTFGNMSDIDLSKQTIFPLSHIVIEGATFSDNIVGFNITLLSMDIVNVSKEETVDIFRGNNNEQDILNTQLAVQNRCISELKRGDLFTDKYQLTGTVTCDPFTDRFEHLVAGWAATFSIETPNDISVCN